MATTIAEDVAQRKVAALARLLAALHRAGDFEAAAKVRASIERVERHG